MSKWKCEICNKEFNNFHAQGFDGKIHCPLCYFKEDNKRKDKKINKCIKVLKNSKEYKVLKAMDLPTKSSILFEILEILEGDNNA